jgi:hypothetical protein
MTLSDKELAGVAVAAGFTGQNVTIAVAVALAESGGNPNATHTNTNGSTDYGLWQINSVHKDLLQKSNWRDPVTNGRMAHSVWSQAGGKWTPWATYNHGTYRLFLARATAASGAPVAPGASSGSTPVEATGAPGTNLGDAVAKLQDVSGWYRVLFVVVGGVLLLWTIAKLTGNNQLSPLSKGLIKAGAKAAIA